MPLTTADKGFEFGIIKTKWIHFIHRIIPTILIHIQPALIPDRVPRQPAPIARVVVAVRAEDEPGVAVGVVAVLGFVAVGVVGVGGVRRSIAGRPRRRSVRC